jgi:hypothetical protein
VCLTAHTQPTGAESAAKMQFPRSKSKRQSGGNKDVFQPSAKNAEGGKRKNRAEAAPFYSF